MALGPLTRQALLDAGIAQDFIDGILRGDYDWTIKRAHAIGVSSNLEAAREMASAALARKDFAISIFKTEAAIQRKHPRGVVPYGDPRVFDGAIPNQVGQLVARTRRYEEALHTRGVAESPLFARGTVDDWAGIEQPSSWSTMAFEFRRAAEIVAADHAAESPAPVLVLLYLCRHHFELALKSIIMDGDRLAGNTVAVPVTHVLTPLWRRAFPLMRNAWAGDWDEAEANWANQTIDEFQQIDPQSMAMRYPVDRSNTPVQFPASLINFSLADFMNAFARAADFLSLTSLWIEVAFQRRPPETCD